MLVNSPIAVLGLYTHSLTPKKIGKTHPKRHSKAVPITAETKNITIAPVECVTKRANTPQIGNVNIPTFFPIVKR